MVKYKHLWSVIEAIDTGIMRSNPLLNTPWVTHHDGTGHPVAVVVIKSEPPNLEAAIAEASMLRANLGTFIISVTTRIVEHSPGGGEGRSGILYMAIDRKGRAEAGVRSDDGLKWRAPLAGPLLTGMGAGMLHDLDQGEAWITYLEEQGHRVRIYQGVDN